MNKSFKQYVRGDRIGGKQSGILANVMRYCVHDADSCLALWRKRNVLPEKCEVASLSFTPLAFAIYKADGVKVRNMVAYHAALQGYSMPMSNSSDDVRTHEMDVLQRYGKYPGAYVPAPKKGINVTPVVALDFASLYPSIIMAHNLSPETVIVTPTGQLATEEQAARYLNVAPHELSAFATQVSVTFGDGLDVVNAYVVNGKTRQGLYPGILRNLFDTRKKVKRQIEDHE